LSANCPTGLNAVGGGVKLSIHPKATSATRILWARPAGRRPASRIRLKHDGLRHLRPGRDDDSVRRRSSPSA
jgi:hypothetical protein